MRRTATALLVGLLCAALAQTAQAQRYDRYDRYGGDAPPPPRGAPPPPPRHAVYGQTYFFGHLGLFEPNDETDGLDGYDTGGAFDVGIGSRVTPNLAIDGTFGAYWADIGPNEVGVVPLTIGARLIIPSPVFEPYAGLGVGLYFAELDEPVSGIDDTDTTFGGYAALGVDAWMTPRTALNFEGKYHFAEPEFDGVDVDVSGWTLSLGVRLSF